MYLVILRRHAPLNEITPAESAEYFLVRQWLIEKLGLRGGCFIHRFGDPKFHASSLPTNHYFENVVVPHGDVPVSETLVKDKSPENKARLEERAKSFIDPDRDPCQRVF
ncbi:MAG: hypothetical protein Q7S18_02155 [bacterium]|nr:hypothetical protein [bacterium]